MSKDNLGAKKYFEANLLDGDKMEDCGKAMIRIDDDFIEVFEETISKVRKERDEEIIYIILKEFNETQENVSQLIPHRIISKIKQLD